MQPQRIRTGSKGSGDGNLFNGMFNTIQFNGGISSGDRLASHSIIQFLDILVPTIDFGPHAPAISGRQNLEKRVQQGELWQDHHLEAVD